jgi:flavin-dependent dehydrogenase
LLSGDASGWTWTARIRERSYQWTRLSFGAPPDADWLPEEFHHLAPLTRARGTDVTSRCATQTAGLGWFMAGEAAATLDPTSSRGVLKAIMSGIAVGTLAAEICAGRLPAQGSASSYQDWLQGWFSHDAAQLAALYRELDASLFAA